MKKITYSNTLQDLNITENCLILWKLAYFDYIKHHSGYKVIYFGHIKHHKGYKVTYSGHIKCYSGYKLTYFGHIKHHRGYKVNTLAILNITRAIK